MGAAGTVVVVGLGGEFGRVCAQDPRTERGGAAHEIRVPCINFGSGLRG